MQWLGTLLVQGTFWIIHNGGSGGPDSSRHFYPYLGEYGVSGGGTASQATVSKDENLSIINRVPMGSIPVVNQF